MMRRSITLLALGFASVLGCGAAGPSPDTTGNAIFGHAAIQTMTTDQDKAVIGKGYYADYYGFYGNYYAINAALYGNYGQYYKNYSYYNTASSYAYSAYLDFYYASYYQQHGQ